MYTLRALLFSALFYSWTTVLAIAVVPLLPGPPKLLLAYGRFWISVALFLLRITMGISHRVRGLEHLPAGAAIFAVKHQSAWDTLAVNLLVQNPAIVLKQELLRIPLFGWGLARARHIAVDRKAGASALKSMVAQAKTRAAEGHPIVIFPQGTRTQPGARQPYQPGLAAIYTALDLPVVPVALNSGLFWPRRSLQLRPGTITVEYLPPIAPGLKRREFMQQLETALETASDRLHEETLAEYSHLRTG